MILPLFLILIFGVVEFGLIFYDKGLITHAGRNGARWGALYTAPRRTDAEVGDHVDNFLNRVNLTGCPEPFGSGAAGVQGTSLTVRVDYPYQYVILSQLIGFSSSLTLRAETVMLLE